MALTSPRSLAVGLQVRDGVLRYYGEDHHEVPRVLVENIPLVGSLTDGCVVLNVDGDFEAVDCDGLGLGGGKQNEITLILQIYFLSFQELELFVRLASLKVSTMMEIPRSATFHSHTRDRCTMSVWSKVKYIEKKKTNWPGFQMSILIGVTSFGLLN